LIEELAEHLEAALAADELLQSTVAAPASGGVSGAEVETRLILLEEHNALLEAELGRLRAQLAASEEWAMQAQDDVVHHSVQSALQLSLQAAAESASRQQERQEYWAELQAREAELLQLKEKLATQSVEAQHAPATPYRQQPIAAEDPKISAAIDRAFDQISSNYETWTSPSSDRAAFFTPSEADISYKERCDQLQEVCTTFQRLHAPHWHPGATPFVHSR
jgi:hypothetical protein